MARNAQHAFTVRKRQRQGQPVWELVDSDGQPVEQAERFIHTLVLRGLSPRTRRTYAYDLLEAYRWMAEADRQPEQLVGEDLVAFIDYQQRPPPGAPSTINRRLRLLQRFTQFLTGTAPVVEAWLEHTLYLKTVSRNWTIRMLRLFFQDLIDWQWPDAPVPGLLSDEDLAPEDVYLPRPLPPELDQAAQKAFIEAGSFPAMGFLLLRYTGMRIGEMRALPLNAMECCGPESFALRVPAAKTYAERLIPLDARTVEIIERIITQRGCLLKRPLRPSRRNLMMISPWGRHLSANRYGVHLQALAAHLDPTEHITCHRFRHTFAT